MTATAFPTRPARRRPASGWIVPLAIALGLGGIVGARLVAVRAGLDPLLVGAAFGAALAALALAAREGLARGARRAGGARRVLQGQAVVSIAAGVIVGLALVTIAVIGPAIGGVLTAPGLGRPAAPFVPWALITLLVAAAEEAVLRGILFDHLERVGGLVLAIALTTIGFALMHVPLYGWHVVPLDLAVGLVLAGLRISTRTLAAPIAAHAVADLATWWL
jgi:membrane protease YdiL (CAAX protease family)